MSRIAAELSRRTSSQYVGDRAKEVATVKAKETGSNPKAMGLLGALAGSAAGAMLGKQLSKQLRKRMGERYYETERGFRSPGGAYVTREYVEEPTPRFRPAGGSFEQQYAQPDYSASPEVSGFAESYRTPTAESEWSEVRGESWREDQWRGQPPSESKTDKMKGKAEELKGSAAGLKDKVSSKAHEMKDKAQHKAQEMKEKRSHAGPSKMDSFKERASHVRERMPSGGEMKDRASNMPIGLIAGGAIAGALLAALLPETRKERKAFGPAKHKATDFAKDKFEHTKEEMTDRFTEAKDVIMGHHEEGGGQSESREFSGSQRSSSSEGRSGSQWLPPEAPTSSDRREQSEIREQVEEDKLH